MELIRGRWHKKYINCWEDKRNYDILRRASLQNHEIIAKNYCAKFSPPLLSLHEKSQIDSYWEQFGIKIYDYDWHRMFYHATKVVDPRFVPDMIAGLVIYEYYNNQIFENTWRDKNMFHRLLPNVPLPKTLGRRIRGRYFHEAIGYIPNDAHTLVNFSGAIWEAMGENDHIVIKNTSTTGFGRGVKKYRVTSEGDISQVLEQWQAYSDYIIQICVSPHKVMSFLNPISSNMIRIGSRRHDNEVDILYAAARVGVENSFTDVSFIDGEVRVNLVGISNEGCFSNEMVDQNGRHIKNLPIEVNVPSWDKIVNIIKDNHLLIEHFDMVGWDFTVDEEGNPICFEWNIQWPGTVLYQFANKRPLFGDKTDAILSFLKNQINRDNYIPYYMSSK